MEQSTSDLKVKIEHHDIGTTEARVEDPEEGTYEIRHHGAASSMLWIEDESGSVGLSQNVVKAFLPLLERFANTGSIRES